MDAPGNNNMPTRTRQCIVSTVSESLASSGSALRRRGRATRLLVGRTPAGGGSRRRRNTAFRRCPGTARRQRLPVVAARWPVKCARARRLRPRWALPSRGPCPWKSRPLPRSCRGQARAGWAEQSGSMECSFLCISLFAWTWCSVLGIGWWRSIGGGSRMNQWQLVVFWTWARPSLIWDAPSLSFFLAICQRNRPRFYLLALFTVRTWAGPFLPLFIISLSYQKKKQPFSIINLHTYTYPYTYTPYEMNKKKTEASSVVLLQHPALLQVLLDHQVRNRSQHKPHRLRVRSTRPVNVHRLVVPIQTK